MATRPLLVKTPAIEDAIIAKVTQAFYEQWPASAPRLCSGVVTTREEFEILTGSELNYLLDVTFGDKMITALVTSVATGIDKILLKAHGHVPLQNIQRDYCVSLSVTINKWEAFCDVHARVHLNEKEMP